MHNVADPVVVGVDGGRAALSAAIWSVDEAVGRETSLRLVTVVDPGLMDVDIALSTARYALQSAVEGIRAENHTVRVQCCVTLGDVTNVLIDESRRAAILCLGADGVDPSPLGNRLPNASLLVGAALSPVALVDRVRHRYAAPADRWVVALLGHPGSAATVLRAAITETRLRRAALMALTPPGQDADEYITGIYGSAEWAAEGDLEIWAMPGVDDVLGIVAQCPELQHVIVVSADDICVLGQLISAISDPVHAGTNSSLLVVPRPRSRHASFDTGVSLVDALGVRGVQTCG
ncbi:universal stress protein [Mycobacterium sp. NPDC050551]|uniref:universal stress protein n=1 Tax=Mycobacterium sp. NPDC050551 TaxID=3155407 RepID=UPI0034294A1E